MGGEAAEQGREAETNRIPAVFLRRTAGARRRSGNKCVHHNIMTQAASHDEKMKNFMGAKIFESGIKNRQLQGVNNPSCSVDDASGQKPDKGAFWKRSSDFPKGQDTDPSHGDINKRRDPFRTGDPERIDDHSGNGDSPYKSQQRPAGFVTQNKNAHRCIGSGNQNENHHMVNFSENLVYLWRNIQSMINGAGCIQQNHTGNKNSQRKHMGISRGPGCLDNQGRGCAESQYHGNKMSQGASRIFDFQCHRNHSFYVIINTIICSFENYVILFYILYTLRGKNASLEKKFIANDTALGGKEENMLNVLYEDRDLIVVWKPVGLESQSSRGFGADMVSEIRRHIHKFSPKSGEPYVGVIHRLDKPVSGVMVYAKTKKAAAALSAQVSAGKMSKTYLTVVCGKPVDTVDKYVDYLLKDEKSNTSKIVDKGIKGGKLAELIFRSVETREVEPYGTLTLAEIRLLTGRHHQIRVQMAGHGLPLWGDNRYHPQFGGTALAAGMDKKMNCGENGSGQMSREQTNSGRMGREQIALAAWKLTFTHPETGKIMTFSHLPENAVFSCFPEFLKMKEEALEKKKGKTE